MDKDRVIKRNTMNKLKLLVKGKLLNNTLGLKFLYCYYRFKFILTQPANLKLHLGCGGVKIRGFINIDHRFTKATDMLCDISLLPFPSNSVMRIECYHVIEHLPHRQLPIVLREWSRILMKDGKLVIECPNFDLAVKEYLGGNDFRIYNVFGLQRFKGDAHLFGYNVKRLSQILANAGYKNIISMEPEDYHKNDEPCIRVECSKF